MNGIPVNNPFIVGKYLSVKLLLKSGLLTQTDGGYRVYDFFLSEWLARVF